MFTNDRHPTLIERLDRHPLLRARIESLLAVVEDAAGDCEKADAAERRMIEELRQMGNDALTAWAERGVEKQTVLAQAEPDWRPGGKKTRIVNLARGSKGVSLLDTRVEERRHGQDYTTAATHASVGVKLPEPTLSGV